MSIKFGLVGLVLLALPTTAMACALSEPLCPPHEVIATAPAGAFLENIVLAADTNFYITNYTGKQVLKLGNDGTFETFTTLDAFPLGIAQRADGTFYVTAQKKNLFGGEGDMHNGNLIYRIDADGSVSSLKDVEGSSFLNGMTTLAPNRILIADSLGGIVWVLETDTGTISKFLEDPLLDTVTPELPTPAANGVKIYEGHVYVSNRANGTILRAPIGADSVPGPVEVFLENARCDDFGFAPDGTLYLTTHRDKVLRVKDGKVEEFAGTGTGINGNTAIAWDASGQGPIVIGDGGFVGNQWYGGPEPQDATVVKFASRD